ncbi:DUF7519 family protein [Halocalculus aciditolerans]|uniref:Uncharacterized protein n=1 Tax=Halocalculus aciditolerans TaxID=1383812 RepID=A0A830FD92_9EURY|nr:hypothetical protein [Halocalculus aciditolerans]GGL63559.1 hypothetical protein GCM10009039_21840 [Halocalculus aciditolerans]
MSDFDDRPARLSARLAVGVALTAAPVLAVVALPAAGVALAGALLLATGAFRGRVAAVTAGTALGLLGVFVAAAVADPTGAVLPVVFAAAALAVAWDLGEYAIVLGRHVGRDARTRNAELTHATLSALVFGGGALAALAVYQTAADGRPVTALVALLAGVLILVRALR